MGSLNWLEWKTVTVFSIFIMTSLFLNHIYISFITYHFLLDSILILSTTNHPCHLQIRLILSLGCLTVCHLYTTKTKEALNFSPMALHVLFFLNEDIYLHCVKFLSSNSAISTNCEWFDKQDLNHKFMLPLISYKSNLSSNVSWFKILYAFVRSKNIPATCCHWFMASWIFSTKVWLAVSVDFIFLNPFCASDKILCLFTKDINVLPALVV